MTIDQSGNVGIGTTGPGGRSQILNANQDANGNTLILGPTNASNLRLGYNAEYSWIQSHASKPLAINPIGSNVGIGTIQPSPSSTRKKIFPGAQARAKIVFVPDGDEIAM